MLLSSGFYGWAVGSAVVTGAVIANAVASREQFYSTVVHLTTSKGSLMAIANMVIVLGLLFGQLVKAVFLGTLRDPEVEHLNERIWPTITDTLLMMTIFRDEIGFLWGTLFGILVFFRVFAWLAADRVAYIEVNPNMSRHSYVRLFLMLLLFIAVDGSLLYYCANETLTKGPSQLIMFGFEYTLILISFVVSVVKYVFNVIDARAPAGWDNKGVCVLYLDFVSDLLRLLTYASFFSIVCYHYGLPLLRSFRKSFEAVSKYRKATENMDQRFPDATAADLQRFDSTCIVCRDEIQEGGKKLPCHHILHKKCLTRWLERSHTCPICSASVFAEDNHGNNAQPHNQGRNDEFWANGGMQGQNDEAHHQQQHQPQPQQPQHQLDGEEVEPVDRQQRQGNQSSVAVMAEMPQVVGRNGQIDPERMLEHMQLLQEQIGLLSDQVALLQAQLLSSLPLSVSSSAAPPPHTPAEPVAPVAPAAAAPQTQTAPVPPVPTLSSGSEARANLTSSEPVTQREIEEREEQERQMNSALPRQQRTEDSPLDELRKRRLQRFHSSGGSDA